MADLYRPGDHYVICDRTGFKVRASETQREWTGARVRRQSFEARHPQDFVRGRRDDMAADGVKPVDTFMGPLITSVSAAAAAGALTISVESSVRFSPGDRVSVVTVEGTLNTTIASVPTATSLTLNAPLPCALAVGSQVTNYTAVSPPSLG
jgi:hypothetical protein